MPHPTAQNTQSAHPAYVRDPDGHLIEIGEATGILDRIHAR